MAFIEFVFSAFVMRGKSVKRTTRIVGEFNNNESGALKLIGQSSRDLIRITQDVHAHEKWEMITVEGRETRGQHIVGRGKRYASARIEEDYGKIPLCSYNKTIE